MVHAWSVEYMRLQYCSIAKQYKELCGLFRNSRPTDLRFYTAIRI